MIHLNILTNWNGTMNKQDTIRMARLKAMIANPHNCKCDLNNTVEHAIHEAAIAKTFAAMDAAGKEAEANWVEEAPKVKPIARKGVRK